MVATVGVVTATVEEPGEVTALVTPVGGGAATVEMLGGVVTFVVLVGGVLPITKSGHLVSSTRISNETAALSSEVFLLDKYM